MNFKEYYSYYLTLHKNKNNRRLHVLGQISTIFYVIICLLNSPVFLIFAAFNNPIYAKAADWVMFKNWIIGNLER